ncbi:MAG: hypothetical protein PHP13_07750 [Methanomicrobium sp.]|nr:hypothetical protein [Methanomicrobium sp.]MDD4300336.1 hypothetical protein [Methanomicrobium sp.]
MRAYFALVDDILTWDEFEEEVCSINQNPDDEESENQAAAAVAKNYSRLHLKISELTPKPTLNSFFCKVIEMGPVIEFSNNDETPGLLRRILAGDETGEGVLIFWNEKVLGTEEIFEGDVLEVAGRFKSLSNITVVDLRRSDSPVSLRKGGLTTLKPVSLTAFVIRVMEDVKYAKRDGCEGRKTVVLVWENEGFSRINIWNPEIIHSLREGATVNIFGLVRRPSFLREYSLLEDSVIEESGEILKPVFAEIRSAECESSVSIKGIAADVTPLSGFLRDAGTVLWLRKGVIRDSSGEIPFVLWGSHALQPLFNGDEIALYNCGVKPSFERSKLKNTYEGKKRPEIHAGFNSCMVVSDSVNNKIKCFYGSLKGIVADCHDGVYLLSECGRYLIGGELSYSLPIGSEALFFGKISINIIEAESASCLNNNVDSLIERLCVLKEKISSDGIERR